MTNYFFDTTHPLPAPGANALVELPDAGTTFVGLDIVAASGIALQTALRQRITIAETFKVQGSGFALELKGGDSAVYNEGVIVSDASHGIVVSYSGTSAITNIGSITAGGGTGIRLSGGHALITNRGTLTAAVGLEFQTDAPSSSDTLDLFNAGTISASGLAIKGGAGADHVTNADLIKTTSASPGAVAIDLGDGGDIYDGTQGNVTGRILLGAGNDTAHGGTGAETFSPGAGSNYIDGGGGLNDTVDYSFATGGVTLSLAATGQQYTGFQWDQILNVENVIGSAQDDKLTGSDGYNTLRGGAGNDTLEGGYGNDVLEGGDGIDTVRYSGASAVTVSLGNATSQNTGAYGSDTLIDIERLEGGSGADKLTGNDLDNTLTGGGGNDSLTGGLGNDSLDGSSGEDTAVYAGNSGAYTVTSNVDGTFKVTGPDGEDTLKDIRFVQFADKTTALVNNAPSSLFLSSTGVSEATAPGSTIATLFGSDPDGDALTYSLVSNAGGLFAINGSSLVLKGALDYEAARQYTVVIRAADAYGKDLLKTVTLNVRNVVETNPLVLKGTSGQDALAGEAGNDRITGLGRNDTLWGEAGNDTLIGGTGNDGLIGGSGKDVFVLDARPNVRTNVDTVYDFVPKDDAFQLSRKIFTKLPKKGALAKSAFWIGDHVHDASDRIIYNKKNGALFYDPDGTGHAAAIQIATLQKGLKLTYHDFFVV